MARYIDADEFKKRFGYSEADTEKEKLMNLTVRRMINEQPTADVAPIVHGEWIYNKYYTWECGNCGFHPFKGYIPKEPNFNFCPNCGAKMDGKKVEE